MIVYSASPDRSFVVNPGDRLVYGQSEDQPQGLGEVRTTPLGDLVVNGVLLESVIRSFEYVRKMTFAPAE